MEKNEGKGLNVYMKNGDIYRYHGVKSAIFKEGWLEITHEGGTSYIRLDLITVFNMREEEEKA